MKTTIPVESNWIELSESKYNNLDDVLKPYLYKVTQYKDGFLPEWKDTIVPGYHEDKGHELRVVYKLVTPIRSSTNSEFGSHHWFITLMAKSKHTGEFLKEKTPSEEHLRAWGADLFKLSNEIIAWFLMLEKGWIQLKQETP